MENANWVDNYYFHSECLSVFQIPNGRLIVFRPIKQRIGGEKAFWLETLNTKLSKLAMDFLYIAVNHKVYQTSQDLKKFTFSTRKDFWVMWKKRLAVGGLYSTNSMVLIEHFQITYLPFKVYVPPVYTLGCRIEPPTSWFNQKCMLIWVTCFYFSFVKYENAPFPRSIPGKALQPRLCLSDLFVKNEDVPCQARAIPRRALPALGHYQLA